MIFPLLYFWHVQGFFYEAVIQRDPASMGGRKISDLLVRYLVPFAVFLSGATVLGLVARPGDVAPHLLPLALYDGDARTSELASGLALYWFLPTFAAFSIVLVIRARIVKAGLRALMDAGLVAAALAIALVRPLELASWVPIGAMLGICLVPLALAYRAMLAFVLPSRKRTIVTLLAAIGIAALQVRAIYVGGQRINISVYDFGTDLPHILLAASASLAMAFIVQVASRYLSRSKWLRLCGERSMVIYLLHPFVQFPLATVVGIVAPVSAPLVLVGLGITVVIVTCAICLVAGVALDRMPVVKSLILPRDRAALVEFIRRFQQPEGRMSS